MVPVDGQNWSSDPVSTEQRGQRLYARGAADMKGFLACALAGRAARRQTPLRMPLQLAFSYDEEIGCLGVRSLIDDMATWSHRPRFCIVGEPTLLRPAVGHKGKTALKATCHGRAAHSACPGLGVNAIYMASDLIGRIRERQASIARSGVRDHRLRGAVHDTACRGHPAAAPCSTSCRNTANSSSKSATCPTTIRARWSVALRARRRRGRGAAGAHDDTGIEFEIDHEYPAARYARPTPRWSSSRAQLTGNRERIKVGFGTEGGLFSGRLGIPTVVCGPGSIDQAHKPDEFVATDQLQRCDAMMDALMSA